MLPFLKLTSDGQLHTLPEVVDALAAQLGVSEQEQELLLPSGQTKVYNRVAWAATYLSKAMLLTKSGRGRFTISARGADVLKQSPAGIDNAYLMQFDEFRAFKAKKNKATTQTDGIGIEDDTEAMPETTPDEQLESAYKELRAALADELLERVRAMRPKRFEQLVVDVLVAMGYGGSQLDAAQVVGKSGDGGIDGVIKEDRLGLDMVYIQAKRHESDVGPGAIREFVGSLGEHKANKGVFITCGGFTSGAKDAAERAHSRIVLIDGDQLAQYMIEHGVGVADHKTFAVKKIDSDYFGDV